MPRPKKVNEEDQITEDSVNQDISEDQDVDQSLNENPDQIEDTNDEVAPTAPLAPTEVTANETEESQAYSDKAGRMKKRLNKQPKVPWVLPLLPGEPEGAREHVQINGYVVEVDGQPGIPKGKLVYIPQQVAEMLGQSSAVDMSAGLDKLVDANPERQRALS